MWKYSCQTPQDLGEVGAQTEEPVSEEFLDKLWGFCSYPSAHYRGFHSCNLGKCKKNCGKMVEVVRNGQPLSIGDAEIRVFGAGVLIYAAPTLIYHYVTEHAYIPPKAFIDAVLNGPQPGTKSYFLRMHELGLEFLHARADGKIEFFRVPKYSFLRKIFLKLKKTSSSLIGRKLRFSERVISDESCHSITYRISVAREDS